LKAGEPSICQRQVEDVRRGETIETALYLLDRTGHDLALELVAVLEVREDPQNFLRTFERDLAPLVARLLRIGTQNEVASIS